MAFLEKTKNSIMKNFLNFNGTMIMQDVQYYSKSRHLQALIMKFIHIYMKANIIMDNYILILKEIYVKH